MKIIERYILKYFIPSFLWCLVVFLFLYIIIDLFGHIDEVAREAISIKILLYYYSMFIPLIFVQTAPIAVLLATIYNLSNLNKNNEITAMRASGINIWHVLRPILITGLLVSVAVFIVNDKAVPESTRKSVRIKEEFIEKKPKAQKKTIENIAIYGRKNRIIYVRLFDGKKNELQDLIIHEHDKNNRLVLKISVSKARYIDGKWHCTNMFVSALNNQGQMTGKPRFYEEKVLDLEETPRDLTRQEWRPEFMTYRELSNYIDFLRGGAVKTLNSLRVDLYYKISFPFVSFIIILVGAPFALHIRRGGVLAGIGIGIIISLFYYGFSQIIMAFGKANFLPPILAAWLGNIIFGVIGFLKIQKLR